MTDTSTQHLDRLFAGQKAAFARDNMPTLDDRLDRLRRLESAMMRHRTGFQKSVAADFGSHSPLVTDLFETGGVLGRNRHIQAELESWMAPSERPLNPMVHGGSSARVIRQPKGVIGNLAPWNFPIECALVMVNDMLAAGNRVIVKASEQTPETSRLLQQAIAEAFDADELAVVLGEDVAFAEYFCTLAWDHLCFTGGGAIGRNVLRLAAERMTPVTLELGGKNPTLFSDSGVSADLIERFLYNRVFKGGQVCTSPDYALVPEDKVDQWVALARSSWSAMYPGYVGHADATGTINRRHYDRILGYLAEAEAAGCAVVSLNGEAPDPERRQIPMYVVIDPPETLGVMTDEIFGPVTAIKPYRRFDEAIDRINAGDRPLAAYFVGRERDLADAFQTRVVAGGIGINVFGLQGAEPGLPFGGVGASGMGCHSGFEGFLHFTHGKSVFECTDDSPLMAALKGPYGAMTQAFADAVFPAAGDGS